MTEFKQDSILFSLHDMQVRFVGKNTDIFGLLAAMVVVIAILAFFVIRYVNRKW
jgi:hypothetical protein